jgi:hypothetical protein
MTRAASPVASSVGGLRDFALRDRPREDFFSFFPFLPLGLKFVDLGMK